MSMTLWGNYLLGTPDYGEPETFPPVHLDLAHVAAAGHRHNGLPGVKPYVWRPGDAEREAEVQAAIAAVRARLRGTS